jgi:hypothetical protein
LVQEFQFDPKLKVRGLEGIIIKTGFNKIIKLKTIKVRGKFKTL